MVNAEKTTTVHTKDDQSTKKVFSKKTEKEDHV